MSNVSQSPSSQLSKTPQKLSNKHVLVKNSHNKPTKRSGKSSRNKNRLLNYNNTSFSNNNNNNNKPLKVVHISNPMRFQVTAAEFRDLVQGLTGRDAVIVDDHHFCGTTRQTVAEADDDDDDDGRHGFVNNDTSSNDEDDDNKVLLHHHHIEHDQKQQEVNLLADCLGPSSWDQMKSFDYYGAFTNDLVVMEDLRAIMSDEDIHY